MMLTKDELYQWCDAHADEQLSLLKTLATIPAPSHHEEKRADYIRNWLVENGAENAFIDDALNVVLPLCCENRSDLRVVMAHIDVVFPDTTPLPVHEEKGLLYAPGVGDDTANVVALMLCAKFFLTHPQMLTGPLLIVFNSCEEGLGNLKGVRQIMKDYSGRVKELVSFDCQYDAVVSGAVGSERWRVTVSTKGGHSYSDFGNANAVTHLSRLICRLDGQEVPRIPDTKTTFNVGLISGGTSVNTIPQNAEMTYEYRSDNRDCLAVMARQFHTLMNQSACPEAIFAAESLGNRPCGGDVPENAHRKLLDRCANAIQSVTGKTPVFCSASTDANIPLSLGIPAATFGLYLGGGAHTREEYVQIDSLLPGLKIALTFLLS